MTNPDSKTSYTQKLVSAARALVTYEVGLPRGCIRINKVLYWLRPHDPLNYPVFSAYIKAVGDLPLGSERLRWDRSALKKYDERLEAINQQYRNEIFDACFEIIDRFEPK